VIGGFYWQPFFVDILVVIIGMLDEGSPIIRKTIVRIEALGSHPDSEIRDRPFDPMMQIIAQAVVSCDF
jgi:hypothetical protein